MSCELLRSTRGKLCEISADDSGGYVIPINRQLGHSEYGGDEPGFVILYSD